MDDDSLEKQIVSLGDTGRFYQLRALQRHNWVSFINRLIRRVWQSMEHKKTQAELLADDWCFHHDKTGKLSKDDEADMKADIKALLTARMKANRKDKEGDDAYHSAIGEGWNLDGKIPNEPDGHNPKDFPF